MMWQVIASDDTVPLLLGEARIRGLRILPRVAGLMTMDWRGQSFLSYSSSRVRITCSDYGRSVVGA